jgi:hypothetical protein
MERGWLLGENGGDVWQVWKVPSTFDVWWFFGGYDLGRYVPFQQALGKIMLIMNYPTKWGPLVR